MLVLDTVTFGQIEGVSGGAHGGIYLLRSLGLLARSSGLCFHNGMERKIMRKEEVCEDLFLSFEILGFHQGVKSHFR
jgi:hypothetical protein